MIKQIIVPHSKKKKKTDHSVFKNFFETNNILQREMNQNQLGSLLGMLMSTLRSIQDALKKKTRISIKNIYLLDAY